MKKTERSSQPLELTPPVWIGLGLIALVGLTRLLSPNEEIPTLAYLDQDNPVIVRSAQTTHQFPSLGIRVALPEGWTYLSVCDDRVAIHPTFVNETEQTILRIAPPPSIPWPEDVAETNRFGKATIEWIEIRSLLTLNVQSRQDQLSIQWDKVDPRKIGRFFQGDSVVTVVAITHADGPQSTAVATFCASISFTEESGGD